MELVLDVEELLRDTLETCVQEGAGKLLVAALEDKVNVFLERIWYHYDWKFGSYPNGYYVVR